MTNTNENPEPMVFERVHDTVLELVKKYLAPNSSIVDLGSGQGAFSLRLKQNDYSVSAVDADTDNWKLEKKDFYVLNLDSEFAANIDKKFDAVVAIEIIEHLENHSVLFANVPNY
jgi:2-polyprenyl-3-methyl-5-hydroxy-6-metoxy-1,4-benzoquinol methylase